VGMISDGTDLSSEFHKINSSLSSAEDFTSAKVNVAMLESLKKRISCAWCLGDLQWHGLSTKFHKNQPINYKTVGES